MSIIEYYPNAERTITTIDIMLVTEKEYQKIKTISKSIKEIIEKELNADINSCPFIRYYVEQKIRNLKLNGFITPIKKEIIIANVLLPDDIKIADILNKHRYTIDNLKFIIRIRQKLKHIVLNNLSMTDELQKEFDDYKELLNQIIELFKNKFNLSDKTIILNKICEILTKYPNYFENKITPNIKKR